MSGGGSGNGEGKQKSRSVGEFAFGADGAAVGEHDVFGDGKAKAGASGFAGAGFVDSIEAFEEAREMFRGNACAEILHEEFDGMGNRAGAEDDASAGSTILQGVIDQVGKNLMNGFAVGENHGKIFRQWIRAGKVPALQMVSGRILNLQLDAVGAGDFAEALFGVVQQFGGRDTLGLETSLTGLDAGQREQVFGEAGHAGGILADDLQELAGGRTILGTGVEQGFRIALDGREGRAQFVGNVGDEVAASFLHPLGLGEIAEHGDGASTGQGRGGHVEGAAGNNGSGAGGLDFVSAGSLLDAGEETRMGNGFDDGLLQASTLRNQAVHGAIGPLHEAVVTDRDDGILHAVEQGFELPLAGDDGGETLFDAARGFVDGPGDAANFVLRSFQDARLKITIGDAAGNVDDALQTASRPLGGDGGHEEREKKRQAGSQLQPAANL